jgi:hypothetical protein
MSAPPDARGVRWSQTLGEAGVLALIALAVRLAHIQSATPWYDDFYHLLAARSWLADGTLGVAQGEYTRAALFTRMVAESLRIFGDSLAAGRVPAVLAGTAGAVAVFLWFRHVGGRIAGWTAGLLLALDAGAVYLSQWVRFYTLHGLLVFVGAVCVYHLVSERLGPRRAAALAAAAVASFALAQHLQGTTLLALGSVGLWAGAVILLALPAWLAAGPHRARRRGLVVVGGLALSAAAAWAVASGFVADTWESYTRPFFWMTGSDADDPRWYFWWFALRYPTFWTLFPVALALAVASFPRPALFSLVLFTVAFVAVSFAPGKQERYLYFAIPFFFGLWGLAAATLLPALYEVCRHTVAALGNLGLGENGRRLPAGILAFLAVAFVASQNDGSRMTLRMVFPGSGERPYRQADWASVLPELRELTDSADVVLSSYLLKPLYYFDRGDFHLSWTETAEAGFADGQPIEFSRDPRTQLPAISTAESLAVVEQCFRTGLVLTERFHLDRAHLLTESTTSFLEAELEQVPLPPDSWVIAYRWRHETRLEGPPCSTWGVGERPSAPLAGLAGAR